MKRGHFPRCCHDTNIGSAVPVLYLDHGFLANLADWALQFVQIVREFDAMGRPTPAASKPLSICVS